MQRFRSGLVFKAHRLCLSLNSRLESHKQEKEEEEEEEEDHSGISIGFFAPNVFSQGLIVLLLIAGKELASKFIEINCVPEVGSGRVRVIFRERTRGETCQILGVKALCRSCNVLVYHGMLLKVVFEILTYNLHGHIHWKPKPESGHDCQICAAFARQRHMILMCATLVLLLLVYSRYRSQKVLAP